MPNAAWLNAFYDGYPRVEDAAQAALEQSLQPRSTEMLWDLVGSLGVPAGARVIDVGCGEGADSLRLAEQFGFEVVGLDPVPRHVELASADLANRVASDPNPSTRDLLGRTRFVVGSADRLPAPDASIDFIWCRDVVVHLESLDAAFSEMQRVLTRGGRALVYQMVGTDLLEPNEAAWLWHTMGVVADSADPDQVDAAIRRAGLVIDDVHEVGSEWGEYRNEASGSASRHLLHVARLRRGRGRFVREFGEQVYETMLGDALWHVYAMIGKLSRRVHILSRP
jgi:SAM-dependent methyltransferase